MNRLIHSLCLVILLSLVVASSGFTEQTPQAPVPTPQNPEVKQMQHLEDLWDEALAKKDQYGLELALSPQFLDISSSGEVTTRNQQIARLFLKDNGSAQNLQQKVVTVRMVGDIALVNGTYTMQKREDSGLVEERGVYTHVFQRVRTAWQCINSQRTLVVEASLTKPKGRKKSSAPAELPMRVPLIYPGSPPPPTGAQSPTLPRP